MPTDGDEWEPSEESFAVLFDWNVFGLLRTSTSAPGHAAVARWLSLHLPPKRQTGSHWKAKPVVDPGKWEELLRSGKEINAVDFAFKPEDAQGLSSPILGAMARNIFSGYDEGLEIAVSVRATRKRHGVNRNRERLHEELLQVIPEDQRDGFLKRAEVKALPLDGGPQESINLIEQRLTTQVEIPIPDYDPQGEQLAAIAAAEIRRNHAELRDEIERLVGPS